MPAISNASSRKSKGEVAELISTGLRLTLLIGLPAAFGLFVLAKPIVALLYFNNTAEVISVTGEILQYLALGVVFLTLVQALTAIIQGLGKPFVPVRNLLFGAIVKIILTYFLTAIPAINVKGAAISTVVAFAIAAGLNFIYIIKVVKADLDMKKIFLKPLASAFGMALIARLAYNLLRAPLGGSIATLSAVLIGGIVYFVLLIVTGTLTSEDLSFLVKSKKLKNLLERFKKGDPHE